MIHYAATGFEDAALHWFVHKVKSATVPAFADWKDFAKSLKEAFQPPHYQQHLRQQLKQICQTTTIQEYGMHYRNIMGQIDNMNELDKVLYFVDGLRSATKMKVSYQAPETFEDA